MRSKTNFNSGWYFHRQNLGPTMALAHGEAINLPHTWNAHDGQDGGNDYYRGTCWYVKKFKLPVLTDEQEIWLEFKGVAMTAEIYLNNQKLARHEGGYSTFRVNLTAALTEGENLLAVSVDNSPNNTVYPQKADFTFYGGIYRDVHLLTVPKNHFALDFHGGVGIKVTPQLYDTYALILLEAWVNGEARNVTFTIDHHNSVASIENGYACSTIRLDQVHLWNGINDPFLYIAEAELDSGDKVTVSFGCRSIAFDPNCGFLLNGQPYRLCGAARHQDRLHLGNALSKAEHEEDMALMLEMGANTIRLAHYQHSQYFYDLCDKYGMIVWAEIPYITEHMPEARENTLSQMTELIIQNYNHPSIICWGLSNEITAHGGVNSDMIETHRILNDLCHQLDPTRPTTMAHAFMLEPDDPFVRLPDICSYNLYYGWYLGELTANDKFFDDFHAAYPDTVIGLSEYGADANPAYQTSHPSRGDWSESYQALYHEHMLKMWSERPYIWAMHCWNMFDFGADGRAEGGKPGQNQKGLITFDRKTKKDAFYLYKAYLSKEPFVHLCGRRYIDRPEEKTEIKVYSNQPSITLFIDGNEYTTQQGEKIFIFSIPVTGKHMIEARSGQFCDSMVIRKTEKANPTYSHTGDEIINWFDKPEELIRPGYFSIVDTMADIKQNPEARKILEKTMAKARESYGEVAKGVTMPESVQRLMDQSTFQSTLKQAGKALGPSAIKEINHALNQIPKNK